MALRQSSVFTEKEVACRIERTLELHKCGSSVSSGHICFVTLDETLCLGSPRFSCGAQRNTGLGERRSESLSPCSKILHLSKIVVLLFVHQSSHHLKYTHNLVSRVLTALWKWLEPSPHWECPLLPFATSEHLVYGNYGAATAHLPYLCLTCLLSILWGFTVIRIKLSEQSLRHGRHSINHIIF